MTSQQSLPGLKVTGYRRVPTEVGHPAACCARNDGSCAYAGLLLTARKLSRLGRVVAGRTTALGGTPTD